MRRMEVDERIEIIVGQMLRKLKMTTLRDTVLLRFGRGRVRPSGSERPAGEQCVKVVDAATTSLVPTRIWSRSFDED